MSDTYLFLTGVAVGWWIGFIMFESYRKHRK